MCYMIKAFLLIEIVIGWPMPKNKMKVRCFWGLATYMRKYVRRFAKIASSLTNLFRGNFTWTSDYYTSFEVLKEAPVSNIRAIKEPKIVMCIGTKKEQGACEEKLPKSQRLKT